MNGGMSYSLKHWFSLLYHPFFQIWLPLSFFSLSLFFLGHASLACHVFSFWGNHSLISYLILGMFYERVYQNMEHLLMDDGDANSRCRNVASGWGRVCGYDREGTNRFSLGSQNLTKLNRMSSSICIRFSLGVWHMALVALAYHWGTCLFDLFENKNSRIQALLEHGRTTLFTISILATT